MSAPYTLASQSKRSIAFVIDDIIVALFIFIIFYEQIIALTQVLPETLTIESWTDFSMTINQFLAQNLMVILLLKVLYHTVLIWQGGKTIGKYMMKITLVSVEGEAVTFLQALRRAIWRMVSETFLYLGFLLAFFLPLKQTLHDKFSQSVVIEG